MHPLISCGAIVNSRDNTGETPLHSATSFGGLGVTEILVSNGADVNEKTKDGESPLYYCIRWQSNFDKSVEMAKFLIKNGADIKVMSSSGESLIHLSTRYANKRIVELLLDHNIDPDIRDKYGNTSLHIAIDKIKKYEGDLTPLEIVKILIGHNADVNAKNNDGVTPLYYAAYREELAIANLLVKNGANVDLDKRIWKVSPRRILTLRNLASKNSKVLSFLEEEEKHLRRQSDNAESLSEISPVQISENVVQKFEEEECKTAEIATKTLFEKALKYTPIETDNRIRLEFERLKRSWDTKMLVEGDESMIRDVVLRNLQRISHEPGFEYFSLVVGDSNVKYAQVNAIFPVSHAFVPVRVWHGQDRLYTCGNALFTR